MATYSIERNGNQTRVMMLGDLTAAGVPEVQAALKQELAQGVREVIFDLAETSMLDSSGIGLLIAARNSMANKQGLMSVVNVSPDILQLFQGMRLVSRLNASGRQA